MKTAKQLVVRMNYNTFVRLKAQFPAKRNESMASYFHRLATHLKSLWGIKVEIDHQRWLK